MESNKSKVRPPPDDFNVVDEGEDEPELERAIIKTLSPDFIGVSSNTRFKTQLVIAERWESRFTDRDVKTIAALPDAVARLERAADLLMDHIERVATASPRPDTIIIALPNALYDCAASVEQKGKVNLDLRRSVKARAMRWGVPSQILREDALSEKRRTLQDRATRAWNFATAMYFKGGGVPWRGHGLERGTCYVGVSFYQAEDERGRQVLRSAVAQAFDHLGQGVVLRGQPFEWDSRQQGRVPHLPTQEAHDLIVRTLQGYEKVSGLPPKRVVVHKTSRYWNDKHPQHDELTGLMGGIEAVNPRAEVDLLTLGRSRLRLARIGDYPPLRGTFATIGSRIIVYTNGFTPYFDTYPGMHVPEPWEIREHHGDSGPKELAAELLALTKMNVNNAAFSDGTPITVAFSRKVSDVLRQVAPEMQVRSEYAYYI